MRYTDLIFDLYGTLVDIHTDESDAVWENTAIYFGYYGAGFTGQELKAAFRMEVTRLETANGASEDCYPDIACETVLADLFRRKGVLENADCLAVNAAQLFRILSMEYIRLYPHVVQALKAFREKGLRLWLLSNAQHVFTAYELTHLGLTDLFDGIYLSSDCGYRKPDSRFINAMIREQNLNPDKCLLIGNDRETDIACAKKAGIDSLYMHTNITPPDQARANPLLSPGKCAHSEWEGSDWDTLSKTILQFL